MKIYSDKLNSHKPRAPRRDALTQLTRCYNNYTAYRDSVDGNLVEAAALHLASVRACLPDARKLLAAIEAECGEQNAAEAVRWPNADYAEAAQAAGGTLTILKEAA